MSFFFSIVDTNFIVILGQRSLLHLARDKAIFWPQNAKVAEQRVKLGNCQSSGTGQTLEKQSTC